MIYTYLTTHTRKKMSSIRRKIADRLVAARNQTAMLTTFNEVEPTCFGIEMLPVGGLIISEVTTCTPVLSFNYWDGSGASYPQFTLLHSCSVKMIL